MPASDVLGRGPLAKPGYLFIGAALGLTLAFRLVNWGLPAALAFLAAAFLVYFFRNPNRTIPADPGAIVSPADGMVIRVDEVQENEFLHSPARYVAIFMNVFDVHVNRSPVAGAVTAMRHRPGEFRRRPARRPPGVNEQQALVLENRGGAAGPGGPDRRACWPGASSRWSNPGDALARGERLGLICFGSRVDLYLPVEVEIEVKIGDRVKAGSSMCRG